MNDKLKLSAARKLLELRTGAILPASKLRESLFGELLADGALIEWRTGANKSKLQVRDADYLDTVLRKQYGIVDLAEYVRMLEDSETTRADLATICGDSKAKDVRSFRGFLVNCYQPIRVWLGGGEQQIEPPLGSYLFVYDCDGFRPLQDVVVVGVENPENFRRISEQRHFFEGLTPIFVSRYPQSQSNDLVEWLLRNELSYLHYGDFDPAGISIFVNEFWKKLGDKATFFIPDHLEELFRRYGNPSRFDNQEFRFDMDLIRDTRLRELIRVIQQTQMGIDQEALIIV